MNCRGCESKNLEIFYVGRSTVSGYKCNSLNESIKSPLFDISLIFCNECNLVSQKRYTLADTLLEKLYEEHVSTQHDENNPFFNTFSDKLIKKYKLDKNKKVLEIGCNCGAFLKILRDKSGSKVMGVEPSKAMQNVWKQRNLKIINEYLNKSSTEALQKYGPFNLIYLRHVFEHVSDPIEFIQYLESLLDTNGSIVLEVPYLPSIIKYFRYENISYSHLHLHTIKSLNSIFKRFKMGLTEFELVSNDGGSIIAHFKKGIKTRSSYFEINLRNQLKEFLLKGDKLKSIVNSKLNQYDFGTVVGYGAGAKGQHLIQVLSLDKFIINVVDDTPGLNGKFIPATNIQIVESDILLKKNLNVVINLAPTHYDLIKKKIPKHLNIIDFINDKNIF